jgi:hypothetical protein
LDVAQFRIETMAFRGGRLLHAQSAAALSNQSARQGPGRPCTRLEPNPRTGADTPTGLIRPLKDGMSARAPPSSPTPAVVADRFRRPISGRSPKARSRRRSNSATEEHSSLIGTHSEMSIRRGFPDLFAVEHPTSGTADDDDDRDDEHADENEARVRAVDEDAETPEEFETDDEDAFGHPEDDDANLEGDKG